MTVFTVFGTRPEAIKLCPLCRALKSREGILNYTVLSGQHEEMTDQVLKIFGITPDFRLAPPRSNASLALRTGEMLTQIGALLSKQRPDGVIVHGDTSTAMAAANAAFLLRIPIFHVEAGLRSADLYSPFPEEYHRRCISMLSTLDFAPTPLAKENLLREGKCGDRVFLTGNTVIDALRYTTALPAAHPIFSRLEGKRIVLLTAHRRENLGEPIRRIFRAALRLAEEFPDIRIVCPLHPNPLVRAAALDVLSGSDAVLLTEPLDVVTCHQLLSLSSLVLTDSGGLQEEAPALGIPVVILRETTERPEGVEEKVAFLAGSDVELILHYSRTLLESERQLLKKGILHPLYGDGYASLRICDALEEFAKKEIWG